MTLRLNVTVIALFISSVAAAGAQERKTADQMLEQLFNNTNDSLNTYFRAQNQKMVPEVVGALTQFFDAVKPKTPAGASPTPANPQPAPRRDGSPRIVDNPLGSLIPSAQAAERPTQAQSSTQGGGNVLRDGNLPQGMERVGPVRFSVPEGWTVTSRRSDAVIIKKGAYVIVSRHEGFRTAPYTPEGIGRAIIKNSWMRATTSQTTVGKEKLPAFRMTRAPMEAALFSYGGGVYMVSTDATGAAFDAVLQSIDVRDLAALKPMNNPPAAPQPSPARPVFGNTTTSPRNGQVNPNLSPDEQVAALLTPARTGFQPPNPLPEPGRVSEFLGLSWDGDEKHQCVWAAKQFAEKVLHRPLPFVGRAADFWTTRTPGYHRVANVSDAVPPPGSLMIWSSAVANGSGHVAVVLDAVPGQSRTVRVIDSNWNFDYRGRIHDVRLNDRILGWLVPE